MGFVLCRKMYPTHMLPVFCGSKGRYYYTYHSGYSPQKNNSFPLYFDILFPMEIALKLEREDFDELYGPRHCISCRTFGTIDGITMMLCPQCINEVCPKYGCKCEDISVDNQEACGYLCKLFSSVCGLYADVDLHKVALSKEHQKQYDEYYRFPKESSDSESEEDEEKDEEEEEEEDGDESQPVERVSTPQLLYELDPEPRETVPEPEPQSSQPQSQSPLSQLTFQFHPGVSVASTLRRNRRRTTRPISSRPISSRPISSRPISSRPISSRRALIEQERQHQQRIMTVNEERALLQTVYQLLQQFTDINTVSDQGQNPTPHQTEDQTEDQTEEDVTQELNSEF